MKFKFKTMVLCGSEEKGLMEVWKSIQNTGDHYKRGLYERPLHADREITALLPADHQCSHYQSSLGPGSGLATLSTICQPQSQQSRPRDDLDTGTCSTDNYL